MRHRHAVDANQSQIIGELTAVGYSVANISRAGNGIPDLIVANRHQQVLVEVKMPGKKLTEDEAVFHHRWPEGLAIVAYCTEDVLRWFGYV